MDKLHERANRTGSLESGHLSTLPLSEDESRFLRAKTENIDHWLQEAEGPLFTLADKLRESHRANPLSSILVDDTSARFIGLFLSKTLEPNQKLPVHFLKLPEEVRDGDESTAEAEIRMRYSEFGSRPAFTTEFIRTGAYASFVCRALNDLGVPPVIATLSYEKGFGREDEMIQRLTDQGAAEVVLGVSVEEFHCNILHRRGDINGVVSRDDSEDALHSSQRIVAYPNKSVTLKGETEVARHLLVRHSRKRLSEMVDRYHSREH